MTKIEIIRKYDCENSLYNEIIHLLLQILHLHLLNLTDKSYNEAEVVDGNRVQKIEIKYNFFTLASIQIHHSCDGD